jgi:hypothetical protein
LAGLFSRFGILNSDGKKKKACLPAGFSASERSAIIGSPLARLSLAVCSLLTVHSSLRHRRPAPGCSLQSILQSNGSTSCILNSNSYAALIDGPARTNNNAK